MKYQDGANATQESEKTHEAELALRLTDAHINPATGLTTDYLNRRNGAIMLLDMLSSCLEFCADFLAWKPMSYREHFRASRSKACELASSPMTTPIRACAAPFDTLAVTMTPC